MGFKIDRFTLLLLGAIGLATWLPVKGEMASGLETVVMLAVALLFFLHGVALSRDQIIAGATHWRLHIIITAFTFVFFPLAVLPVHQLTAVIPQWMPADLGLGFLYLGVLPSAVSSSIAFTAMAKGNVPAAICSAAASNVFGMMLTPFLLLMLVSSTGIGDLSVMEALKDIVLQLLLPFAVGHGLRPWLGGFTARHETLSTRYDQCVIWLVVYSAFSHSVASGLWQKLPVSAVFLTIALCILLLGFFMAMAVLVVRRLGLPLEDEAAVVFCGSKKSLASGLPMAKVLFSGHPGFGMIVLPIMCYNQIQIIIGAMLAQRYRKSIEQQAGNGSSTAKNVVENSR